MIRPLLATALALLVLGPARPAAAQDFPVRPLRLVVAQAPATPPDLMSRIMATEMAKTLGQSIVVENKAGANSVIGFEFVATQPADGYTLLGVNVETHAIMPLITANLRFDPIADLPPFVTVAEGRYILASAPGAPFRNFEEFVRYAKANPGKLNYASSSPIARLSSEALIRGLGVNVVHVPYSSGVPAYQAIAVGDAHIGFVAETTALTFGDKMRVLGLSGAQRHPAFPNAPTFTELGQPRIGGINFTLNARAGLPRAVQDRLVDAAARALRQPAVAEQLAKLQLQVVNEGPEAAGRRLAGISKTFSDVARDIGLKKE